MYLISRRYQPTKRRARRAIGTLLLALPLCGVAFQSSPAQAQPAPNPSTAIATFPLPPGLKSEVERFTSILRYEEVCKLALDLKLENATIEDAATRIKATFSNQQIEIRQRDARPLKISLDLRETTIGSVLTAIATLSDCQLWVLPDGLLIAPPDKLNTVERDLVSRGMASAWSRDVQISRASPRGTPLFTRAVVAGALGGKPGNLKTTLDKFSPESRAMLQQIAAWQESKTMYYSTPALALRPDSPVELGLDEARNVSLKFNDGSASNSRSGLIEITIQAEAGVVTEFSTLTIHRETGTPPTSHIAVTN